MNVRSSEDYHAMKINNTHSTPDKAARSESQLLDRWTSCKLVERTSLRAFSLARSLPLFPSPFLSTKKTILEDDDFSAAAVPSQSP